MFETGVVIVAIVVWLLVLHGSPKPPKDRKRPRVT
jgi:hypothetical protein